MSRYTRTGFTAGIILVVLGVLFAQVFALPSVVQSTETMFPELSPWSSPALAWGILEGLFAQLTLLSLLPALVGHPGKSGELECLGYLYAAVAFAVAFVALAIAGLTVVLQLGYTTPGVTWGLVLLAILGTSAATAIAVAIRIQGA